MGTWATVDGCSKPRNDDEHMMLVAWKASTPALGQYSRSGTCIVVYQSKPANHMNIVINLENWVSF